MSGEVFRTETWTLQYIEIRVLRRKQAGRLEQPEWQEECGGGVLGASRQGKVAVPAAAESGGEGGDGAPTLELWVQPPGMIGDLRRAVLKK